MRVDFLSPLCILKLAVRILNSAITYMESYCPFYIHHRIGIVKAASTM